MTLIDGMSAAPPRRERELAALSTFTAGGVPLERRARRFGRERSARESPSEIPERQRRLRTIRWRSAAHCDASHRHDSAPRWLESGRLHRRKLNVIDPQGGPAQPLANGLRDADESNDTRQKRGCAGSDGDRLPPTGQTPAWEAIALTGAVNDQAAGGDHKRAP